MTNTQSDEELLGAFAGGNRDALGLLASRYEPALLGLATGVLRSPDAARDAVQNTWVRVIRFAAGFQGRCSVKTWLYRILINECRTMRRTRTSGEIAPCELPGEEPGDGSDRESYERIEQIVRELPDSQAEVALLCFHRGMTHEMAAAVLEIPVGTLKTRLYAAMKAMRARLAPEVMR